MRSRRAATTVAVLGCGIDRDYPAAHRELAADIAAAGLVVSEYAPGVEPAPWRFPARNRIVAGLCAATVVVEARERSGALITCRLRARGGTGGLRRTRARSRARSRPARTRCSGSARRRSRAPRTCSRASASIGAEPGSPSSATPRPLVLERIREGADERRRARARDGPVGGASWPWRSTELELAGVVDGGGGRLPCGCVASRRGSHARYASAPRARRLVLRRRARRASARIARAAFLPGPPVTPPPGCVPAPHM